MQLKELLCFVLSFILIQTLVSAQRNNRGNNVHSRTLKQSSRYHHRPADNLQPAFSEDDARDRNRNSNRNSNYKRINRPGTVNGRRLRKGQFPVNRPAKRYFVSTSSGISLSMNLVKFANPKLQLQTEAGTYNCVFDAADLDKNCMVYFSLLFTDASGQIMLRSGNVMWGSNNHQLDLDTGEFDFENSTMWFSQSLTFQFTSRPSTMLFIVYGLGNMVDTTSKKFNQGAAVMEYFVHNLTDVTAGQEMVLTYHGTHSSDNSLDMSLQLDCDYVMYGSTCNMTGCAAVSGLDDIQECSGQTPPYDKYVCGVHEDTKVANSQNCSQCPEGLTGENCYKEVKDGSAGEILNSLQAERDHFRTATIVLGVFFGLFFIIAAVLIVFIVLLMNSDKSNSRTRDTGPVYRPPANANPPIKDSSNGRSDRMREWHRPDAAPAAVRSAARGGSSSSGNHRSSPVNSSHSNNSILGTATRPYTDV